jgi:hypothetical protein
MTVKCISNNKHFDQWMSSITKKWYKLPLDPQFMLIKNNVYMKSRFENKSMFATHYKKLELHTFDMPHITFYF